MPKNLQSRLGDLKQKNTPNSEIIETLKKEGYSSQEIYNNMSAQEKNPDKELAPPTPSEEMGAGPGTETPEAKEPEKEEPSFIPTEKFPAPKQIPQRQNLEELEEIAESIIEEKMNELSVNFSDLNMWKEKTATEMEAIKQEILRLRNQFENLQSALVGKVEDYKKNIGDVSVEVKTLSKVLEKILQPLTMNVKELGRITERLKK
ncbi:MAG: hypothetical protein CMH63_00375 [Nanoarchaeota archaeon]|jgi:hypothetical protein|nr:hypothetical protein [Nanoarchaeota archaeon]|tara:strand:+ start:4823 stop:5437 length:615 start_codon:yes stop_codon:yes gene_type:complete